MSAVATRTVRFDVCDVLGTRSDTFSDVPAELTIAEILPQLVEDLRLPTSDASGPLTHSLRRNSDGRILNDSDLVEELADETTVLMPSVNAGAGNGARQGGLQWNGRRDDRDS